MLRQISNTRNLRLAWRRITTGSNNQYKSYFRQLYYAYEVSLTENLQHLSTLLLTRAFQATPPQRVYIPKGSGLQRPIGLLHLEDQIVLQAFANIIARKVFSRRQIVQRTNVYSNILTTIDNPFFFRNWRTTYPRFRNRVEDYYRRGYRWIADFDLAAFYDTISHDLLLKTAYPRTRRNADIEYVLDLLQTWGSPRQGVLLRHGLPQGPIASDFLAEVFMLPIDEALRGRYSYIRYVDDVQLFGRTEDIVRRAVLSLEVACRERGLIPQATKTSVRRASSSDDAVQILPSLSMTDGGYRVMTSREGERTLQSAISGRPAKITDKSRARYVFYRSQTSPTLLKWAIRLLPRHPEHNDAIMAYLAQYKYRRPIETLCMSLLNRSPYESVKGAAYHTLARYLNEGKLNATRTRGLIGRAILAAGNRGTGFSEKLGALHFLCIAQETGFGNYSRFTRYQNELIQACLGPVIPQSSFVPDGIANVFLSRTAPEPGISLSSRFLEYSINPADIVDIGRLPIQTANVFRTLGLITIPRTRTDPLAEILYRRYGVNRRVNWHSLLGAEYAHALGLLAQADAVFDTGRSEWLSWQNSFNYTLFLAFQSHLDNAGLPGVVTTVDRNGHLVNYGSTLQITNLFSRHYPNIATPFREMNNRRNRLPASHPYEQQTRARTAYLTNQERNRFVGVLRTAYAEIANTL